MSDSVTRAEQALVGAVLISNDAIDLVAVPASAFSHVGLGRIWGAMRGLRDASQPIDDVTLDSALPSGVRDAARQSIMECSLSTPTAANIEHYAGIVTAAAAERAVVAACGEIIALQQRDSGLGFRLLDDALARLTAIDAEVPQDSENIGESLRTRFGEVALAFDAYQANRKSVLGVTTGLDNLDRFLGGLTKGIATVVAGRPGMGKSSLGATMADASSAEQGVHVFSLEDPRAMYADRIASRHSGIPAERIRQGAMTPAEFRRYQVACEAFRSRGGWELDDRSGISASEIARSVRRKKRENNTSLVIVDYLQLMSRPHGTRSPHEAHTINMNALADLAKQEHVAMVVMSQLNRNLEQREDKRPMMSDLRESGTIEERAKCIVFCYRGSIYGEPKNGRDYFHGDEVPTMEEWESRIDLIVAKNSNGRTGIVKCGWHGPTTRVFDKGAR